jgi:hypothetical protein
MAKKSGVYIGPELEAAIGPVDDSITVSARINAIGDRYAEIMRRAQIEKRFSEPEWNLLRDSLNGVYKQPASQIARLWHGIEDSIELDGLADKWEVNGEALLAKLRGLSFVEEVAAVESVERWWIENSGVTSS